MPGRRSAWWCRTQDSTSLSIGWIVNEYLVDYCELRKCSILLVYTWKHWIIHEGSGFTLPETTTARTPLATNVLVHAERIRDFISQILGQMSRYNKPFAPVVPFLPLTKEMTVTQQLPQQQISAQSRTGFSDRCPASKAVSTPKGNVPVCQLLPKWRQGVHTLLRWM
jgi:hypothetical protein